MTVAVKRHQAPRQRIPPEVPFSRSHFRYVDSISLIGMSNQLLERSGWASYRKSRFTGTESKPIAVRTELNYNLDLGSNELG
jgi:hypothetical protein